MKKIQKYQGKVEKYRYTGEKWRKIWKYQGKVEKYRHSRGQLEENIEIPEKILKKYRNMSVTENIQGAPRGRKFKLQSAKDGSFPFSTGSGGDVAARPGSDSWSYFKKIKSRTIM